MRLKKLIIYGYGKWVDTEFEVDPDLQVFYGQNEAGKSTLMSFIQSILFGFPMRHSSSLRYEPKESSRYGGKLILDDKRFGEVIVERVNGKVTGDVTVTLEDGTQGDERLLETLLNHKKRSFFESIYSFNLKGVEETSEMNKEQFNRFFLSAGSLGNESFLKKADHYQQKASHLFKPTGRKPKLNELFRSLQKQKEQLNKARENNEQYVLLVKEKERIADQIDTLEQSFHKKKKEIEEYQHLLKNIETINEINELKKEIDQYPSYSLPEDGLIHLNHINKQLEELREQTKDLYNQQKTVQDKYRPSKELLLYQEHEEAVNKLLSNWDHLELKVELIKDTQHDLAHLEKQSFEFKLRKGLPLNEALPTKLTPTERNELQAFADDFSDLIKEQTKLQQQLHVLDLKIETNNEHIDSIEQSLWPANRFKAAEEQENSEALSHEAKNKGNQVPVLVYSSGSLLLAAVYLISQSLLALFLIPAYLLVVTVLLNRKPKEKTAESAGYDRSEYYHQKSLRDQWKDTLATNDVYQQQINEYKELLTTSKDRQNTVSEVFLNWKKAHHYPSSYDVDSILDSLDQLDELRKIDDLKDREQIKVTRELEDLRQILEQNSFARLFLEEEKDTLSVFSDVKKSIRQIENDKRMQQAYIKETQQLQNSILYYVQQEKEQIKLKNELTDHAGVKSEEEFIASYQRLSEKNQKIKRFEMLKETINIDQSDSDTYTVDGLKEEVKKRHEAIKQNEEQQKEWTKNAIEIEYKISELEDGGIYSELLQIYENEKSLYQEVADEWSTYKIAAALIENTLKNAKENQLPQTLKLAETYFSYITSNHYTSISLEADQFFVSDSQGKKWQASELSRGTVEPLYIAIRLAFVVSNREHIEYPVIIDDSFVNIDENRKGSIYKLLNEISQSVQVIYFTFDETTLDYIPDSHVIKLNHIK